MNGQHGPLEWTQAKPDWLTIPQAKFFFAPELIKPGEELRAFVARQCAVSFAASPNVVRLSDRVISVRHGDVQLVVDGETGELRLEHIQRSRSLSADGFSELDYKFVCEPDAPGLEAVEPVHRNSVVELASFALKFNHDQRSSFQTALEAGHAMLVGRWHDLREPFRRIQPDQWQHFLFDPSFPQIARAMDGDARIFSPMVMPIEGRPIADDGAHEATDPLSWMISLMSSSRDKKLFTKEQMLELAQNRWPDLSETKFYSLWTMAVSSSGATAWSSSGRPPKNRCTDFLKS